MKSYDDFITEVRRRKGERWLRILATETPGHAAGRRRRDAAAEAILLRLDRARLERRRAAGDIRTERIDPPKQG